MSYQYKFKNHKRAWQEPLSRYNAVSVRRETMSGSGLELAGPATISYEHVNVIYLQHSTDDSKSLPLQIIPVEQDALVTAEQYAAFTRKPITPQ